MKFASKLSAHLTPEWRKQYIDYDGLKEFLLTCIDKKAREAKEWDADFVAFIDKQDQDFLYLCEVQLRKVDSFFAEKLAAAKRKFLELLEEVDHQTMAEYSKMFALKSTLARRHQELPRQLPDKNNVVLNTESVDGPRFDDLTLEEKCDFEADSQSRRRRSSPFVGETIVRVRKRAEKTYKKLRDLKLAFSEFYLNLVLLQNYQVLNYTGFRKILKKHDKLFRRGTGAAWCRANVDEAEFNTNRDIDVLISDVEDIYTEKLEHGDRPKTMKRLRVPPLSERHNPKAVFRFGFFAGVFLVQIIVITLTYFFLRSLPQHYVPALRIFRTTFLLILFLCLFGLNTYVWRTSGVNHVLIFEIDPRSHLDHYQLLETSFFLADVWGCAVLCFMYSEALSVPSYASPFALVLFLIIFLVHPFRFGHFRARKWLLRVLGRILSAPFCEVKFADFWLADQLNSMNFLFPEVAFFICFYASQVTWMDGLKYMPVVSSNSNWTMPICASNINPVIAQSCECSGILFGIEPVLRVLPAWFRFAQCLRRYRDMKEKRLSPHIINAGKYSTSFFLTACSVWFKLDPRTVALVFLILTSVLHSAYTYSWDIRMDWGLLECDSSNRLLREEMVYQRHTYYYAAILENFVLRFSWVIRISLRGTVVIPTELSITILLGAEVIRRFIWNFFRLENEHLNNCGEFRAVRDILIRPERREYSRNTFNSQPYHNERKWKEEGHHNDLKASTKNAERSSEEFRKAPVQRMWSWISRKMIGQLRHRRLDNTAVSDVEMVRNARTSEFRKSSQMLSKTTTTGLAQENPFSCASDAALDSASWSNFHPDPKKQDYFSRVGDLSSAQSIMNLHQTDRVSPTTDANRPRFKDNITYITLPKQCYKRSRSPSPEADDSSSISEAIISLRPTVSTVTVLYEDPESKESVLSNRRSKAPSTSCFAFRYSGVQHSAHQKESEQASPNSCSGRDPHRSSNAAGSMASLGQYAEENTRDVSLTDVSDREDSSGGK